MSEIITCTCLDSRGFGGKIRKRNGIRFKIESANLNPCLTLSAILYLTTGNLHDHALGQKLVH